MKGLFKQIAKFGVVGVVCFLVDFGIYTLLNIAFRSMGVAARFPQYYLVSKLVSVVVSMVCNYLLSMRFVFTRKDDMSRRREFGIFVALSLIGLALSELILFVGMDVVDPAWPWLVGVIGWWGRLFGMTREGAEETFWVLVSTAIVMCYNFISRKLALEQRPRDGRPKDPRINY